MGNLLKSWLSGTGAKGKVVLLNKDDAPNIAKVSSMLLAHGDATWTVWVDCNGDRKPVEGLLFDEETKQVVILNENS
jgi:hypothetical protein